MGIRMKTVTAEKLLDLIALRGDDIVDAVVTRKGNKLQITQSGRGDYIKRQITVTVKDESYD